MSRLGWLARRLVMIWGLALAGGCDSGGGGGGGGGGSNTASTGQPPAADPTYATPAEAAAVVADLRDDMQRLQNLKVVEVFTLDVAIPEAANCYGGAPCDGFESNAAVTAEYARQAPRLAQLTQLAETLAGSSELPTADPDVTADIAALNGLKIVDFGALVKVEPASSPNCYNLPCPEDVASANAANQHHADVVHSLAAMAVAEQL
jgi:hypothetical protein